MAFHIANQCFLNRVSTFISSPPTSPIEKMSSNFFTGKILRPLMGRFIRKREWSVDTTLPRGNSSFPGLINALEGLQGAVVMNEVLEGALSSKVLSNELKVLMFAVVARSLNCKFCQEETGKMARDIGFDEAEYENAVLTFSSPKLNATEQKILAWTRQTVHYKTANIQKLTRSLAEEMDSVVLLEAIGVAAIANSAVRLAILLE